MKRFGIAIFAMLVALVAGCRGHGLDEKDYVDNGVQWGPAQNGLQVGLARRLYEPGKAPGIGQTYFIVQLRNVTGRALSVLAPTQIGGVIPEKRSGDESVSVKLIYDSAAGLKTAEFTPPNKPVVYPLEPGKNYNLEVRLVPGKFGLDRFLPGRLMATYSNAQGTIKYEGSPEPVSGIWTGEVRSGEIVVDVSEPPKGQAAADGSSSTVQEKREANVGGYAK